jgi:hypothetical protein
MSSSDETLPDLQKAEHGGVQAVLLEALRGGGFGALAEGGLRAAGGAEGGRRLRKVSGRFSVEKLRKRLLTWGHGSGRGRCIKNQWPPGSLTETSGTNRQKFLGRFFSKRRVLSS